MAYDAINAIIGIEKKAQEIIAPASKAQAEFDESLKAEKEKIYAAKNAEYEETLSETFQGIMDASKRFQEKHLGE